MPSGDMSEKLFVIVPIQRLRNNFSFFLAENTADRTTAVKVNFIKLILEVTILKISLKL